MCKIINPKNVLWLLNKNTKKYYPEFTDNKSTAKGYEVYDILFQTVQNLTILILLRMNKILWLLMTVNLIKAILLRMKSKNVKSRMKSLAMITSRKLWTFMIITKMFSIIQHNLIRFKYSVFLSRFKEYLKEKGTRIEKKMLTLTYLAGSVVLGI
jgi:hypothetical protein